MDIQFRGIYKSFGAMHANVDINLDVPSGTILGILGENGAGKSTLMKILSGFIRADKGKIFLEGRPVLINSPADAIRHGVGMLHQDPLDFPPMCIIDNLILGCGRGIFINRSTAIQDFKQLAGQFDFSLNYDAYVDTLTVGERQQLEIIRLLWLGARVLIFDEPTTGISAAQKEKLFTALRLLAQQGKTILFVSHKLDDIEGLCHRVVVLRQGYRVGEAQAPYVTGKLVEMMFGKTISIGKRNSCATGKVVLNLSNLSVEDYRLHIDVTNLEVRAGEVIGLAGMEGSGQRLFLQAVAGLTRTVRGRVVVNGKDLTGKSYHAFKQQAVAYLPAARLEEGLVSGLSLTEHFVMAQAGREFFIDWDKGREIAQKKITAYMVRGTPSSTVESLSGGNQQRALLALLRDPLVLILLENPTRGLDIESTIYVWSLLKERCALGTSILFISSDLEEILQYSDRVLVFFSGKVTPPLVAAALTTDILGQLIGGKGWGNYAS